MLDRLHIVKQRFDEISDLIIQPDVISDQKRYVQLNQEYKGLKALAEKRDEYVVLMANIDEANEIIADGSDADMTEMAKMQLEEAKERLKSLEIELDYSGYNTYAHIQKGKVDIRKNAIQYIKENLSVEVYSGKAESTNDIYETYEDMQEQWNKNNRR